MLRKLYKSVKKDIELGLQFTYTRYINSDLYDYQEHSILQIIDGEIKYANRTYSNVHDIKDKNQDENWDTVEEVLNICKDEELESFSEIFNNLNKKSMGYKICKKIINNEIKMLNQKIETFNKIKTQNNITGPVLIKK